MQLPVQSGGGYGGEWLVTDGPVAVDLGHGARLVLR